MRAETRSRVIEAAEQLSFTPNSLLAGRTRTVGLLTSDLEGLCEFVLELPMTLFTRSRDEAEVLAQAYLKARVAWKQLH